jgi:hypothetical protein
MFLYIINFGFPLQASRDIRVDRKVALTPRQPQHETLTSHGPKLDDNAYVEEHLGSDKLVQHLKTDDTWIFMQY